MTREHFETLLQELQDDTIAMGQEVTSTIGACMDVFRRHDVAGAHELIAADSTIDRHRHDIERQALLLIATQQPLAGDLRAVAAILSIATELERIGDYCEGIATLTLRLPEQAALPPPGELVEMAELARQLLVSAMEAFRDRDLAAAARVWGEDDRMDGLYERVFRDTMDVMAADPARVQEGTYLLWVAHNLERMGDRATNIVEQLSFMVTGAVDALHPSLSR